MESVLHGPSFTKGKVPSYVSIALPTQEGGHSRKPHGSPVSKFPCQML